MSAGFSVAIQAIPFLELLDREVQAVSGATLGTDADAATPDTAPGAGAGAVVPLSESRALEPIMEASRLRLAQGVDSFVRGLPPVVRNDSGAARAAAYALVGLADEKMLHHPAGGMEAWRERLLEFELYGSALAGQEIIRQAREAAQGMGPAGQPGGALLAPLYLVLLREGFEGSLRTDSLALASLTQSLEDTIGAARTPVTDMAVDSRPSRVGFPPAPLAIAGFALWLVGGVVLWQSLAGDDLARAGRLATQVESGAPLVRAERIRTMGPSRLPDLTPATEDSGARRPPTIRPPDRGDGTNR